MSTDVTRSLGAMDRERRRAYAALEETGNAADGFCGAPIMNQSYAIVRQDMPPQEWWDGYYVGATLAKSMAEYWSQELGIACFAILVSWPALPERGYHTTRKVAP